MLHGSRKQALLFPREDKFIMAILYCITNCVPFAACMYVVKILNVNFLEKRILLDF